MVCASEGDDLNDTNHTSLRKMTFSIFNRFKSPLNKNASFSDQPLFQAINPPEAQSPKIDEDRLLMGEVDTTINTTHENFLSEQDATITRQFYRFSHPSDDSIAFEQYTYCQEIEGTEQSDEITINAQPPHDYFRKTDYQIDIFAKGGNDTIINNHRGAKLDGHTQSLMVRGGEGFDTFESIHKDSKMSIFDMEKGERFIVSLEHVYAENLNGTMYISNTEGSLDQHQVVVPDGFTLEGNASEELNAMIYTMMAE